ncbi:hypothetical protein LAZ67_16002617 [Cordylochernes scorpioides]|uniref:Transposase n=1 Tax=Cordylochernes scorpioides TaxID=51811 RepID=A0ABY6LGB1_9ARAC|nr:hypothetical protein LAZ67_16002617 [Cordylochernes scorpioides]
MPNINGIVDKTTRASSYLLSLIKKAWGLECRRKLTLYKSIFRSTITYGQQIWFPFISKKAKDKLNSLHYNILKHCIQAYTTTSSNFTDIPTQIPKLTDYIESNILKNEIGYNRFNLSNRKEIANYNERKSQENYEESKNNFKCFFISSKIPKFVKPNFYNVQLFTGHGNFKSYLFRIRKIVSPRCSCGAEEETPEHILNSCPLDSDFSKRIITGDETWCFPFDPQTKKRSLEWHTPSSPRRKKVCLDKSKGKVMLVVFFDYQGLVYYEFIKEGHTINKQVYKEILVRLRDAIRRKRNKLFKSKQWKLIQDNTPAHRAIIVQDYLAKHSVSVLPHPPYSSDIAPCDFFSFPKLKMTLKGRRFSLSSEVIENATVELNKLRKIDFELAFQRLFFTLEKMCR